MPHYPTTRMMINIMTPFYTDYEAYNYLYTAKLYMYICNRFLAFCHFPQSAIDNTD